MAIETAQTNGTISWLSPEDARSLFEAQTRALLGMSGDEFVRKLEAGEFGENIDDLDYGDILYLAMLRPRDRENAFSGCYRIH